MVDSRDPSSGSTKDADAPVEGSASAEADATVDEAEADAPVDEVEAEASVDEAEAETLLDTGAKRQSGGQSVAVPDDEGPTRDIAQPAIGDSGPSTGGSFGTTTGTELSTPGSPVEALMYEEITRTRAFLSIVLVILASMAPLLPVLNGHQGVEWVLYAAMAICAGVAIWLRAIIRDPARYTPRSVMPAALVIAMTTWMGVLYWGVYSPAPIIIVMGIYFFCRAQSFASALVIYFMCAGFQGVAAALFAFDVVEDPGIFVATDQEAFDQIIAQAMVQLIYLFAFWLARVSRRATLHGIEQLRSAVRQVSQREALLQEARDDLDRALRIGGAGRYTDQVIDTFRLGAIIGRGAMAEVYEAVHTTTNEEAAVKLLHRQVLDSPSHVERFLREAQAIDALQLPNVVRIVTASEPTASTPYLVMERLHGHNLAHYLRKRRRLSGKQLVTLVEHVGNVIDAAREKGIVHRDLKPGNLFLAEHPDGKLWKILDFGVSKLEEHSGTLTQGHVVGTPAYMAPEQARGLDVDYRADLYSLGAIAYRCATGHPPFSGKDLPAILHAVVYRMPPRPSDVADLHPDVDLALAVALAKRRSDRFDSGSELAEALELAYAGELDELTRRHGRTLQAELPWGSRR